MVVFVDIDCRSFNAEMTLSVSNECVVCAPVGHQCFAVCTFHNLSVREDECAIECGALVLGHPRVSNLLTLD